MAQYSDITIDQGSTYIGRIPVVDSNKLPVDLTAYEARGQIRRSYTSINAVSFNTLIDDPESGVVTISLSPQETADMRPGRYVFDVEIYTADESDVIRISEGQVEVTPRATLSANPYE